MNYLYEEECSLVNDTAFDCKLTLIHSWCYALPLLETLLDLIEDIIANHTLCLYKYDHY
jgi:hypothetical protein